MHGILRKHTASSCTHRSICSSHCGSCMCCSQIDFQELVQGRCSPRRATSCPCSFLILFLLGSFYLWLLPALGCVWHCRWHCLWYVFRLWSCLWHCHFFGVFYCSTSWLCPWHCLFVIGFLGQYSASLLGAWEAQQDSLGSSCEVLAAPAGVLPRGFLGGSRGCCGDALGFGSRWGANWEAVRTHQGSPTH